MEEEDQENNDGFPIQIATQIPFFNMYIHAHNNNLAPSSSFCRQSMCKCRGERAVREREREGEGKYPIFHY